jgi:hypothetical protein
VAVLDELTSMIAKLKAEAYNEGYREAVKRMSWFINGEIDKTPGQQEEPELPEIVADMPAKMAAAARVVESYISDTTVLMADMFTPERAEYFAKAWPSRDDSRVILDALNAMPGPPISDKSCLHKYGSARGIKRPTRNKQWRSNSSAGGLSLAENAIVTTRPPSMDGKFSVALRQIEDDRNHGENWVSWDEATAWAIRNGVQLNASEEMVIDRINQLRRDYELPAFNIIPKKVAA